METSHSIGLEEQDQATSSFSPEQRQALVEQNLPLVYRLADTWRERLSRHGLEFDDLIQEGCIGLMDAAGRYDPGRNSSFSHFAGSRVIGSMIDAVRHASPLSRGQMDQIDDWQKMEDKLHQELQRTPLPKEIAERLDINQKTADTIRTFADSQAAISIDAPVPGVDTEQAFFHDILPDEKVEDPQMAVDRLYRSSLIDRLLEKLTDRARGVIIRSVVEEVPLRIIGDDLGVGESRASQIRSASLNKLSKFSIIREAA